MSVEECTRKLAITYKLKPKMVNKTNTQENGAFGSPIIIARKGPGTQWASMNNSRPTGELNCDKVFHSFP
jgi:hypothetical protein